MDASVEHARASALRDLKRALKVEQRNRRSNLRVEAMQQQLAGMKYGRKALKAKVQEVKMKDKAKYMKLNGKVGCPPLSCALFFFVPQPLVPA